MHFNHSSNGYIFSYTCIEAPLTEIEKIRATTMMRNNRILQSLGIPAVVSMIRKTHGGRGGKGGRCGSPLSSDGSYAIIQGGSSNYNPRDDQVTEEEEEVQGSLGEGIVQVHNPHHCWRAGITFICLLIFVLL
jgi:hypothetical protein